MSAAQRHALSGFRDWDWPDIAMFGSGTGEPPARPSLYEPRWVERDGRGRSNAAAGAVRQGPRCVASSTDREVRFNRTTAPDIAGCYKVVLCGGVTPPKTAIKSLQTRIETWFVRVAVPNLCSMLAANVVLANGRQRYLCNLTQGPNDQEIYSPRCCTGNGDHAIDAASP